MALAFREEWSGYGDGGARRHQLHDKTLGNRDVRTFGHGHQLQPCRMRLVAAPAIVSRLGLTQELVTGLGGRGFDFWSKSLVAGRAGRLDAAFGEEWSGYFGDE